MNDILTRTEAVKLGDQLAGMKCQSTILTQISDCGQKKEAQPAQRISGYEIIDILGGVELMLFVGGESVLIDTCYNFQQ
jgi:hypothetical protein